jgi:hypothetical protein
MQRVAWLTLQYGTLTMQRDQTSIIRKYQYEVHVVSLVSCNGMNLEVVSDELETG